MGKFLFLGKYSAAGSAGVLADGLTARKRQIEEITEKLGGRCLGMYGSTDGRWDVIIVNEIPDETLGGMSAAMQLLQWSSGGFDRWEHIRLFDTEEVDTARANLPGWRPPGEL